MAVKKILIIHFRVGKTDGVSLEIGAWKQIFKRSGYKVELAGGNQSIGADYVINGFENQLDPKVYALDEEAFGNPKKDFQKRFLAHQEKLKNSFRKVIEKSKPDRVIVSNVFSVGENFAAAGALAQVLSELKIKTIAVCHDFYWENKRYEHPTDDLIRSQLEMYYPPIGSWIKHVVINSIAQKELLKRKSINATILYDTLDFNRASRDKNGGCRELLARYGVKKRDLIFLQATRIVRRKNIELSMDLVAEVQKVSKKRPVFVMAGYAEKRDRKYQTMLRQYAKKIGITLVELNGLASNYTDSTGKACDLMSIYPYASIITYPSRYEGFGNQFLEAIHARKPVVVWEYPVFKTDIEPKGFKTISLGDKLIHDSQSGLVKLQSKTLLKARDEVLKILKDKKAKKRVVDLNFRLGKKYFSYERAMKVWKKLLS